MPVDIGKATPEAGQILEEAESAAKKKLEEQLPNITTERNHQKTILEA